MNKTERAFKKRCLKAAYMKRRIARLKAQGKPVGKHSERGR